MEALVIVEQSEVISIANWTCKVLTFKQGEQIAHHPCLVDLFDVNDEMFIGAIVPDMMIINGELISK